MSGTGPRRTSSRDRIVVAVRLVRPADLAVVGYYLLFTTVCLWPLLSSLNSVVPHSIRDPGFQATVLHDLTQRLLHLDFGHIFDGSFYYPASLTLAMADDQIGLQALALPMHLAGADALLVLNILTVLSFPATAICGDALGRYVTGSRLGGFVVGTAFAFAAYRIEHVIHLQLLQSWTVALAFLGLEMTLRERSRRGAVLWASAIVAAASTSLNYLLLLAIVQPVYLVVRLAFAADRRDLVARLRRVVRPGIVAGCAILVLLVPYVVLRLQGYSRSSSDTFAYSARLTDYLVPAADNLVLKGLFTLNRPLTGIDERELLPGAIVLLAMLAAILVAVVRREGHRLRRMAPWLAIGAFSVLFSLGPYLWPNTRLPPASVAGLLALPYRYLARPLLLESLRSPARFGLIVLLAVAIVAAMAIVRATSHLRRGLPRSALVLGLALLMGVEYAVRIPVEPVAWGPDLPAAYAWLRAQPAGPVVELPASGTVVSFYMLASTVDGHPRLNGWAGFVPRQLAPIRKPVTPATLDTWLAAARRLGATYVVIHGAAIDPTVLAAVHAAAGAGTLAPDVVLGPDEVYRFGEPSPSSTPPASPSPAH